jgi:hypothetical protein
MTLSPTLIDAPLIPPSVFGPPAVFAAHAVLSVNRTRVGEIWRYLREHRENVSTG